MLRDCLQLYRGLIIEMEYFLSVCLKCHIPVAYLAVHVLTDALQGDLWLVVMASQPWGPTLAMDGFWERLPSLAEVWSSCTRRVGELPVTSGGACRCSVSTGTKGGCLGLDPVLPGHTSYGKITTCTSDLLMCLGFFPCHTLQQLNSKSDCCIML